GIGAFDRHRDLSEVFVGEADGLEWAEWSRRYGSFDMEAEPDRLFAPQGDSWNSFNARVRSVLRRLADEHEDQTVVAVCHAGVAIASLRLLRGTDPTGGTRIQPSNPGLTEWEWEPDAQRWTLHSFNEAPHLVPPVER